MIVDGRALAAKIKERLKLKGGRPVLMAILVGNDPASATFVRVKKKFGEEVGAEVRVQEYGKYISQTELEEVIKKLSADKNITGIVVQLPLPKNLNTEKILALIPAAKDPDALGPEPKVLAPVAGAAAEILREYKVGVTGKRAVVVGQGKLVGRPVARWLAGAGADVTTADVNTKNLSELLKTADLIVSGAGAPGLIKPEMLAPRSCGGVGIEDGVVLIDAGTSEQSGKLAGDADPACAAKCSLFTPVPGGVGPLTIAKLFENLFELMKD